MIFKTIAYIIIYILFACMLVAIFIRSRREAKAERENKTEDGGE